MKIGILISGRGSNMVALVEAVKNGEIPDSQVAVVISDKADAAGLAKAQERGVETVVVERNGRKRVEHDAEIVAELQERGVELVCLAGYMRLLSPSFVQAFPDRIVNIHPSLLPAYPGLDVHERVLAAGETVSGCTVHFVDEELDHGRIILQKEVPVLPGDTPEILAARILDEEHQLYVDAVKTLGERGGDFLPRGNELFAQSLVPMRDSRSTLAVRLAKIFVMILPVLFFWVAYELHEDSKDEDWLGLFATITFANLSLLAAIGCAVVAVVWAVKRRNSFDWWLMAMINLTSLIPFGFGFVEILICIVHKCY